MNNIVEDDQQIDTLIQSFFSTRLKSVIPGSCFARDPAAENMEKLSVDKLPLINRGIERFYKKHGNSVVTDTQYPNKTQFTMMRIVTGYVLFLLKHNLRTHSIEQLAPDWPAPLKNYFKRKLR